MDGRFTAVRSVFDVEKLNLRTTVRAGDRLGMEAAVGRIMILRGAIRAHGKFRQGSIRAVIRNILDDGKPWPAVRAIDERIPITAVVWIE